MCLYAFSVLVFPCNYLQCVKHSNISLRVKFALFYQIDTLKIQLIYIAASADSYIMVRYFEYRPKFGKIIVKLIWHLKHLINLHRCQCRQLDIMIRYFDYCSHLRCALSQFGRNQSLKASKELDWLYRNDSNSNCNHLELSFMHCLQTHSK